MYKESYRSGHNELHSKCSCPVLGHVGSNPTLSVHDFSPQAGLTLAGVFFTDDYCDRKAEQQSSAHKQGDLEYPFLPCLP